jgi:hypothetical protein
MMALVLAGAKDEKIIIRDDDVFFFLFSPSSLATGPSFVSP